MENNFLSFIEGTISNFIYEKSGFHIAKYAVKIEKEIKKTKSTYNKVIEKIKNKDKIRVAFYVFEKAKWKTDTLFKLMQKDSRFEPFIVSGITDGRAIQYDKKIKNEKLNSLKKYFESKNMKFEQGFDTKRNRHISLKKYQPDIVFYQQHVGNPPINDIDKVVHYALCFYVPYNVPNYGNVAYDYQEFCAKLFRFYCLNDELKKQYEKEKIYAHNIKTIGHTALDEFYLNKDKSHEEKYIIYAPHFSIQHPAIQNPFYYSTFTQNSKIILEYAKKHPEYIWVFKPHPNLRETLDKMKVPKYAVDDYYNEWKKIGIVSEDAEYFKYFLNSKLMLTDCGSFLTEYFCTGKPLIHMKNPNSINWPCKSMKSMHESFYETYDNRELIEILDRLLIQNDDYKAQERNEAIKKLDFANQYAAQNIMDDLISIIF